MNPDPVDLQAARPALAALAFEHLRLVHQPVHQEEREDAERHVDEKNPVPGIVVGDPAADRRADGRRHDHGDAVDGEGLRTLPRREGIGQHGLFAGRHAAAAQALQNAENDQGGETGCEPAQQRRDREQRDAEHVEALAADHVGEPAAHRQHHRIGDQIGGDDPGALVDADRETAGDVAQRDIGDRSVEHDHEGGDGDDDGDQPRAAVAGRRAAFAAGVWPLFAHFVLTVRHDRHAGPEQHVGRPIEHDLDRHALDDLDVIAGRVLRRQQAERGAAAGLDAVDMAFELAAGIGVDGDLDWIAGPYRLRAASP